MVDKRVGAASRRRCESGGLRLGGWRRLDLVGRPWSIDTRLRRQLSSVVDLRRYATKIDHNPSAPPLNAAVRPAGGRTSRPGGGAQNPRRSRARTIERSCGSRWRESQTAWATHSTASTATTIVSVTPSRGVNAPSTRKNANRTTTARTRIQNVSDSLDHTRERMCRSYQV